MDPLCAPVYLDLTEMDETAQVKAFRLLLPRYDLTCLFVFVFLIVCLICTFLLCLITFLQCPEKSFMTEERQPPLLLFLCMQSQLLKAGGNLKRLFSLNYKAGSNQTFILKFIPH